MSKFTIVESVGHNIENVTKYDDLAKPHPSAGREHNREYKEINGNLEEVSTKSGNLHIKKDFVLLVDGKNNVDVPSPVAGYAYYNNSYGTVTIYDKPAKSGGKLIAKLHHIKPGTQRFKNGEWVEYGSGLGQQSGTTKPGIKSLPVHSHVETDEATFRKYIDDINSGKISPNTTPEKQGDTDGSKAKEPAKIAQNNKSEQNSNNGKSRSSGQKEKNINIVRDVAKKSGIPEEDFLKYASLETGDRFDEKASRGKNGAKGLFQFVPSTAKAYNILGKEFDPVANATAAAQFYHDNFREMTSKHKKNKLPFLSGANAPNGLDMYMAHQQGVAGYESIQKAISNGKFTRNSTRKNIINNISGFNKDALYKMSDQELAKTYVDYWKNKYQSTHVAGASSQDNHSKEAPPSNKEPSPTEAAQENQQNRELDAIREKSEQEKQKIKTQDIAKKKSEPSTQQVKAKDVAKKNAELAMQQAKAKDTAKKNAELATQQAKTKDAAKKNAELATQQAKTKDAAKKNAELATQQAKAQDAAKPMPIPHTSNSAGGKPAASAMPPAAGGHTDQLQTTLSALQATLAQLHSALSQPIHITVDVQNGNIVAAVNAANRQQQRRS